MACMSLLRGKGSSFSSSSLRLEEEEEVVVVREGGRRIWMLRGGRVDCTVACFCFNSASFRSVMLGPRASRGAWRDMEVKEGR